MKTLLDTTAYVAFKQNRIEVVEYIVTAESILFSPVVLGELMFGFRSGTGSKGLPPDRTSLLPGSRLWRRMPSTWEERHK